MPVNPSSDPSLTLPNVHIKTSLLMALMQTNNIGKPPAIVTTKYSVRQRSSSLTKLAQKLAKLPCAAAQKNATMPEANLEISS
jgi:hypothetical protein